MKTKPVEDKPIYDDSSTFEKGRLKYILEVFPCNKRPMEVEKLSEITTKIMSKHGSKNGSKRISKNNSQQASLEGSRLYSRNSKNVSNGMLSGRMSNVTPDKNNISVNLSGNSGIPKNLNDS